MLLEKRLEETHPKRYHVFSLVLLGLWVIFNNGNIQDFYNQKQNKFCILGFCLVF